ncbi:MAG: hypothetical protein KatS3mg105_1808 [Gemmatales bacterium]|nr:MAG: hypothetical protein KatS3mg105_1808 [Gemmatales bacterium]
MFPLRKSLVVLGLIAGCNSMALKQEHGTVNAIQVPDAPPTPGKHSLRVSHFMFLSDFELDARHPLFKELGEFPDQVYGELKLPHLDTIVLVYLFENKRKYEDYMAARYPSLPNRRAFFVAQPRTIGGAEDLLVYTYWGDRIQEDLRHELTHALLHGVLKDVPLWLDEGLAEYFETPPAAKGVNRQHLEQIKQLPFRPDLVRLERLESVQQMAPAEYREAWAWVHLMLQGPPAIRQVLLDYLQALRTNPKPGSLSQRLANISPRTGQMLVEHLARLP